MADDDYGDVGAPEITNYYGAGGGGGAGAPRYNATDDSYFYYGSTNSVGRDGLVEVRDPEEGDLFNGGVGGIVDDNNRGQRLFGGAGGSNGQPGSSGSGGDKQTSGGASGTSTLADNMSNFSWEFG